MIRQPATSCCTGSNKDHFRRFVLPRAGLYAVFLLLILRLSVVEAGPRLTGTLNAVSAGNRTAVIRQADGSLRKVKFIPGAEFYRSSMLSSLAAFKAGEQVVVHIPGALNEEPLISDQMSDLSSQSASPSVYQPPVHPINQPGGGSQAVNPAPFQGMSSSAQPAPMFSPVIGEVLSGSGMPSAPNPGAIVPPGSAAGLPSLINVPGSSPADASAVILPPDEKEKEDDDGESTEDSGVKVFEGKVNQIDVRQGLLYLIQLYPPDLMTVHLTPQTVIRERATGRLMQAGQIRIFDIVSVTGRKKGTHEMEAVNVMVSPGK
jgi:hypothetical protein